MKRCLKFPEKWISWIRECLSTATATVLVNGIPSGEFQLERGICQGNPLSPFIFLIAAEDLLMKKAVKERTIRAVEVGRDKVPVSHLQYVDVTLISVVGDEENAQKVKWLLSIFEVTSGLSVNYEKSYFYG